MTARRRRRPARGREDGFTLVEALVAFAIVALTLVMAMRVLADGAGWARRGPMQAARIEEAASVMSALTADPTLRPGLTHGAFADGAPWHVLVSEVPRPGGTSSPRLMRIAFHVGRLEGRPLFVTIATGSVT